MEVSILLIEADRSAAEFLRGELERRNYRVHWAAAGVQALVELEWAQLPFDLVISSAEVGDVTPAGLLRAAKARSRETEMLVSVRSQERSMAAFCMQLGVFALVQRPYDLLELHGTIGRALEHRAFAREARILGALRTLGPARQVEDYLRVWVEATGADGASLLLPGAADHRLRTVSSCGSDLGKLLPPALVEQLVKDPLPAILAPRGDLADDGAGLVGPAPIGPLLVQPLRDGARLIGALCCQRTAEPFTAEAAERLSMVAGHLALLIENAQLNRRLASSDRLVAIGQLAAGVAHELRSPLSCVAENASFSRDVLDGLGALQAGAGSPLAQARESLSDVIEAGARMRDLVRDVGSLASADETTRLPFQLNAAIQAAARMTAPELRGRVKLVLRLADDTSVFGSAGRMTQVFVNLLVNAVHAIGTEPKTAGQVMVHTFREGGRMVAEVADNGAGIGREVQGRLFEPFFTTKAPGEGTGLGLFLCREIVRRHGGELRVRSTPGRGATFVLSLPVDSASEESRHPQAEGRKVVLELPAELRLSSANS